MKKFTVALLFATLLAASPAIAQYKESPNALALRWTKSNFQFPFSKDINYHDYTSGLELMYVRNLAKPLDIAFPLKVFRAELPTDELGAADGAETFGSLDLLFHLKYFEKENFISPYLLGGAGMLVEIGNQWEVNAEFPVGVGLNFRLGRHVYLNLESQYRFNMADLHDQLQHSAGIWVILGKYDKTPPIMDADKDGVPDAEDQCPAEAGTAMMFGCPDTDGDGVANRNDECPDLMGVAALAGCPDNDSDGVANKNDDCPDQPGNASMKGCPDSDSDGIADHLDACPTQAGVAAKMGCPDTDKDGDGIGDDADRCPTVAGKLSAAGCPDEDGDGVGDADDLCPKAAGLPTFKGCPDTDRDGIPDNEDRCPNSIGTAANNGCPEMKAEEKAVFDRAVKDVQFETGKAVLLTSSYVVLDEIVGVLNNYPDHKLRIDGHTDSIGEAPSNQTLSEKRAKSAYDYLVSKGINAGRLSYQGFGESKPIADNKYAPGRTLNRRVEFDLYVEGDKRK